MTPVTTMIRCCTHTLLMLSHLQWDVKIAVFAELMIMFVMLGMTPPLTIIIVTVTQNIDHTIIINDHCSWAAELCLLLYRQLLQILWWKYCLQSWEIEFFLVWNWSWFLKHCPGDWTLRWVMIGLFWTSWLLMLMTKMHLIAELCLMTSAGHSVTVLLSGLECCDTDPWSSPDHHHYQLSAGLASVFRNNIEFLWQDDHC